MKNKYIMIDNVNVIMFTDMCLHSEVARGMGKVTGAGFYDTETRKVDGFSSSLNIGPAETDEAIINKSMFGL